MNEKGGNKKKHGEITIKMHFEYWSFETGHTPIEKTQWKWRLVFEDGRIITEAPSSYDTEAICITNIGYVKGVTKNTEVKKVEKS